MRIRQNGNGDDGHPKLLLKEMGESGVCINRPFRFDQILSQLEQGVFCCGSGGQRVTSNIQSGKIDVLGALPGHFKKGILAAAVNLKLERIIDHIRVYSLP